MKVYEDLEVVAEYIPFIEEVNWASQQNALLERLYTSFCISLHLLLKEALLADRAKEGYHHLIDLIIFQTDGLRLARLPMQVDYLWGERFNYWYIEAHRELIAVISVPREAETIVYQKEFVRSIAVAVEDLLARLDRLSVLVD